MLYEDKFVFLRVQCWALFQKGGRIRTEADHKDSATSGSQLYYKTTCMLFKMSNRLTVIWETRFGRVSVHYCISNFINLHERRFEKSFLKKETRRTIPVYKKKKWYQPNIIQHAKQQALLSEIQESNNWLSLIPCHLFSERWVPLGAF